MVFLDYTKIYQRTFFRQRYVVGSRYLSYLEDTDRDVSLKYKEGYFSIMLPFGLGLLTFHTTDGVRTFGQ